MHCFGTGRQAIGALAIVFVVATAGCSSAESVQLAIPTAGGPCLADFDQVVGETGILVTGESQSIGASLGYQTINYCPGHPDHGRDGIHGDGFFYTLESRAVDVQPRGQFTVSAPGYAVAGLVATWSSDGSAVSLPIVDLAKTGETTWQLTAPKSIGVHRLDLRLDWAEGEATYAVLIATDGSASTRTTTTGPPTPGLSTDEGVPGDAIPPELIFDNGEYEETGLMEGTALLGTVNGVEGLVFVCRGVQITATDPSSPGLAQLMEDIAEQVLDWQDCVPTTP